MGWKKRDFVLQAFDEIGIASYDYDLAPEQLESARRKLDSMMAMWNSKGIRIGYPLSSTPNGSDLDDVTDVTDEASEAICLNLALRLAPSFGKTVSPETKIAARQAYDALLIKAAQPGQMQFPGNMPMGAGNRSLRYNRFSTMPKDTLDVGESIDLP